MATTTKPTIDKGSMILGIVQLFDDRDALACEVDALRRERESGRLFAAQPDGEELPPHHQIDMTILAVGQKRVYEDSLYSWKEVTATKDEKTGSVEVTPFDRWLKAKVSNVPDYMSFDEFCAYFDSELHATYERERDKAIAALAVKDEGDE